MTSEPDIKNLYELIFTDKYGQILTRFSPESDTFTLGGNNLECDCEIESAKDDIYLCQIDRGKLKITKKNTLTRLSFKTLACGGMLRFGQFNLIFLKHSQKPIPASCISPYSDKLIEIIQWLASPTHSNESAYGIIQGTLKLICDIEWVKSACVLELKNKEFQVAAQQNISPQKIESLVNALPDDFVHQALKCDIKILIPQEIKNLSFDETVTMFLRGTKNIVAIPMSVEGVFDSLLIVQISNIFRDMDAGNQRLLISLAQLLAIIRQNSAMNESLRKARLFSDTSRDGSLPRLMIGRSQKLEDVYSKINRFANANIPVVILGETGTGKELAAIEMHRRSPFSSGNFIPFNAAALPENLIEAELFGYKKGAFSGALSDRVGLIEQADNGTLFVDEIGEMPLSVQAKLLRVLQEKKVLPIGGNIGSKELKAVNFRLVCATHRNIYQMIESGTFREDLYYRISTGIINLPRLNERSEDIPMLIQFFKTKFIRTHNLDAKQFSPECVQLLSRYTFPGNIRQLQLLVERLIISVEEPEISAQALMQYAPEISQSGKEHHHLPPIDNAIFEYNSSLPLQSLAEAKNQWLRKQIILALECNQWNKNKTAKALKIGIRTLFRYLDQLDIKDDTSAKLHQQQNNITKGAEAIEGNP